MSETQRTKLPLAEGTPTPTRVGNSSGRAFQDRLRKTVEWLRNNEAWWGEIKSGEYWEYYRKQYEERIIQGRPAQ